MRASDGILRAGLVVANLPLVENGFNRFTGQEGGGGGGKGQRGRRGEGRRRRGEEEEKKKKQSECIMFE